MVAAPAPGQEWVMPRGALPAFLGALRDAGYRVVGPTVRDAAIVYGEIRGEADLPIGWTDRQEAGTYRLERRPDNAVFGYNVGPHSWKKYLFPAREHLWTATRTAEGFRVVPAPADPRPLAFLGVRACEMAAIRIQDRVFLGGAVDPGYAARRGGALLVAVQCGQAAPTCFCVSMGTGPAVTSGHDIALTEILAPGPHRFLVSVGSEAGARVLVGVPGEPATPEDLGAARAAVDRAAASMGRAMPTEGIRELLLSNPEHPRWEAVARRCLACTNCTMACPTCFCSTTEEVPDLAQTTVERHRRWDSCFNLGFSELHGTSVRKSTTARYRQWLTHKLASWYDQFDSSGCVGCGRCITWCPVGIDLTEEVAAIRASPGAAWGAGEKP